MKRSFKGLSIVCFAATFVLAVLAMENVAQACSLTSTCKKDAQLTCAGLCADGSANCKSTGFTNLPCPQC